MKQTAVEWLIENIKTLNNNGYEFHPKYNDVLIEQANAMFEEQVKDAYKFGLSDEYVIGSERYYNETFKSEQDERKIRPA
jgi:hypothetical protein